MIGRRFLLLTGIVVLLSGDQVAARAITDIPQRQAPLAATSTPAYCTAMHNVGRLVMPVTNVGVFGTGHSRQSLRDCFSGQTITSCEFPKGSFTTYLSTGALWVGAVVDGDTLVSVSFDGAYRGREFNPAESPFGNMQYRSTLDPTSPRFKGAVSEQDYIAVFYDTCRNCADNYYDPMDNRYHKPLGLEVTQRSYSWSFSYAQDFVLLDYSIKNIGEQQLRQVYLGIYVDGDVYVNFPSSTTEWSSDDLCGFLEYAPASYIKAPCAPDSDLVNLAWTADNDGDLYLPQDYAHLPHVTGTRLIRTPSDSLAVSFNWWTTASWWTPQMDYGPQARDSYRDLGFGGLGTPFGDRNKYHFLRNGEKDFDQAYLATIPFLNDTWVPPPRGLADSLARGMDSRYLLSFGPFGINPGQTLPITLAYVAGMNFHSIAKNHENLPYNPWRWYENVHFKRLGDNSIWADWIYDNPGVDSDSDGYAGEFTICQLAGSDSTFRCDTLVDTTADPDTNYFECGWFASDLDTIWRKGDGVPDFKGAAPPMSPSLYYLINQHGDTLRSLRVEPGAGKIRLVWNGFMTENLPDAFTRRYDFEGYRVYVARDERPSSFSLVTSYDIENYNRWDWSPATNTFELNEMPFSVLELRCMYASDCSDSTWHPKNYPRTNPLTVPGLPNGRTGVYFFEEQDFNRSILANDSVNATTDIRKVYPNAPRPAATHPDSIAANYPDRDDPTYFTEDGFLKYYEYEYTFENLLPSVTYWVNVTAFDHGFPELNLPGLESPPALLPVGTFAMARREEIDDNALDVIVYPNPYRKDANYRPRGLEGRNRPTYSSDHTRLIHFANLPAKCTISIYSIDGDLVRKIRHDVDENDLLAIHESWDLITRNSQLVVTGLYYFTVEDDRGNVQIGKLVIIM